MTAVEARSHLAELHAERGLALSTGVADIASYMADLDEEIAVWRWLYNVAAVTEIATLRAELSGAQVG
jgi:predicted phage gp36 major capsid-like protein